MATLRLALPTSLQPPVEAVLGRLGMARPQLISPAVPADARQKGRWERLWLERRRGAGAGEREAEAALQNASLRALLAVFDHQADAALLDAGDCANAWKLLEPRMGHGCADLWIGSDSGEAEMVFGWCDWPKVESVSLAVDQLRSATGEMARLAQRAAQAALVNFAGGPDQLRAASDRFAATLNARSPATAISLYSPLFFRQGALDVAPLLAAIRRQCGAGLPVLCIPQLERREFAAAILATGGWWAGPLRAGAEAAAAQLSSNAPPVQVQATCSWLLRRATQAA